MTPSRHVIHQWIYQEETSPFFSLLAPLSPPAREYSEEVFAREVFTTWRSPCPKNLFNAHITRLLSNAENYWEASCPFSVSTLQSLIQTTLHHTNPPLSQRCRLSITVTAEATWQLTLQCQPWQPTPMPLGGLSLATTPYQHPHPTIKHNDRAVAQSLRQKHRALGVDDVIWTSLSGHWLESTNANLFIWVRDKRSEHQLSLHTAHPNHDGCLNGITRQTIIEQAQILHIPVIEKAYQPTSLLPREGGFLCNSIQGIQPIGHIIDTHQSQVFPLIFSNEQQSLYQTVWNTLFESTNT